MKLSATVHGQTNQGERLSMHPQHSTLQTQTSVAALTGPLTHRAIFAIALLSCSLLFIQTARAQHEDEGSYFHEDHPENKVNSWPTWGGNLQNTHGNMAESTISSSNVGKLALKWSFTTAGDVSATPTVGDGSVYIPDWGGFIYRINADTGKAVWSHKISDYTNNTASLSRTSLAIAGDRIIFGDQGGATVIAVDKRNGQLLWQKNLDSTIGAWITSSPVVLGNRIYVGVASAQEGLAARNPTFDVDFRGSVASLDLETGEVVWQTSTVPEGYTGGSVWGGNFVVDLKRNSLYLSTGNNYSVPNGVDKCISGASSAAAKASCLSANDSIDALMALNIETGKVKWSKRFEGVDTWTVSCVMNPTLGVPCPDNSGPDYDFGSAPNFFTVRTRSGDVDVLGAGQKSGVYWALDPDSGRVLWATQVGPGGSLGGIEWGSAVDDKRVYVALNDSNRVNYQLGPDFKRTWNAGSWAALDASTGKVLWQVPATGTNPLKPTLAAGATGQMSVANGVVFAGSLSGDMVALEASSGKTLWKFPSGGSVVSGASIVDGTVYWGSGYKNIGVGTGNNKLYAFSLPEKHDRY